MNHPTIRTLYGAGAPASIDAAHTALVVIDFQNEYFDGKLPIPDGRAALANARRLVDFADSKGMPVFHIQHVGPAGSLLFAEDGEMTGFHAHLQPGTGHTVLRKTSVSAFLSTDLDARLKAAGMTTLIISGLMTHNCVAGAARDAVPLGYAVIVADDACATRDIDGSDGEPVPHRMLHRATLAGLADTFGDVMTTDAILGLALV